MDTLRFVLKDDATHATTVKLIVEPQDYTYRGPRVSKRSLGMFSSKVQDPNKVGTPGPKTKCVEVDQYQFGTEEYDEDECASMNVLLRQFPEFIGDPTIVARIERFNSQLQRALGSVKGKVIGDDHITKLLSIMDQVNIGYIYKLQLVVSKVSRTPFAQCVEGKDGLFHRTVKSKQAFIAYQESSELQIVESIKSSLADIKIGIDAFETTNYAVEEVNGRIDGTTHFVLKPQRGNSVVKRK